MMFVELATLEAGLPDIRSSPKDQGRVELIVRRPAENEREVLSQATLDCSHGLVGDTWGSRGGGPTRKGLPHPGRQLTLMNARVAALVARTVDRWPLAGDQLYVDLDLSGDNVPPGTLLAVGSAVVEVSDQPHRGCKKFAARFGPDALRFVNSDVGRELNLRGVNARVIAGGIVRSGAVVRKTSADAGTTDRRTEATAEGPHGTDPLRGHAAGAGRVNRKVAPWPGVLSTQTTPP